ncbi:receptor activity-modifying protein 1-like [Poeciliopsis prolifica]|uniref:receptor activity-modifying protein 1-like n=1 Tax=Poeciliopsis prolifica TaxID=188132 RepID=UPI0024139547|nr:receptor activity-modifying protein 1-like [Poeciliopsis prolifica]
MISYLLLPAVILCVAVSQQVTITDELHNQTFSVFTHGNSTTNPNNKATDLYKDHLKDIEDELEKNTSLIITEDDEHFQDPQNEIPHKHCHRGELIQFSHQYCGQIFHAEMHDIHKDDWCVLKHIIRIYNNLTLCVELVTVLTDCFFPNPDVQDFFLYIHSTYFQNCTKKEELLQDAPTSLVVALTIIEVSFIPVLVCLVLWKS